MTDMKETIKINKENDNSFVIIRTITEKVDAKALLKIIGDVENGLKTYKQQLDDFPKQNEEKEKFLKMQVDAIDTRLKAFKKYEDAAKRAVEKETPEIKTSPSLDATLKPKGREVKDDKDSTPKGVEEKGDV